jgi:acetyl-CoA C-acetyltransferase
VGDWPGRDEQYALASHQRAVAAIDGGAFAAEIVPYGDVSEDECPRRDTSLERMAGWNRCALRTPA